MRSGTEHLCELNIPIIRYVADYLGITTTIRRSSDMPIRAKGTALLLDICRHTGANQFLIPRSARRHLDEPAFRNAGIFLQTYRLPTWTYPQLWGDFLPNLSIFDMLFNLGPKTAELLRS